MARGLQITLTNEDRGHWFSEWVEPLADYPNGEDTTMGEIYRHAQEEYGRCKSKVYVEKRVPTNDEGGERWETLHIGWFFVGRQQYEDTNEPYLRGAWVTVGEYHAAIAEHIVYTEEATNGQ